jgi:hypothetical protein
VSQRTSALDFRVGENGPAVFERPIAVLKPQPVLLKFIAFDGIPEPDFDGIPQKADERFFLHLFHDLNGFALVAAKCAEEQRQAAFAL